MTDPNADPAVPTPAAPSPWAPPAAPVPTNAWAPPAAPGPDATTAHSPEPPSAPATQPVLPSPVPPSPGYGSRRVPIALVAVLAPVLAVVVFAGGVFAERTGALGTTAVTPTATPAPGEDNELALIEEAWRTIHDNYVDAKNLDDQELAYGAIRGMTEAVGDEGHTEFMTAEEAKAVDQSLSGQFVGIGVQVSQDDDDNILIRSVFPETPAQEAGLQRGDRIKAVDGTTTEGESLDETISRVRGPEGEDVTLTIGREGKADFDVTIKRRQYDLPLGSWAMVPGTTIAMIRLEQFASGAADAVKADIEAAKAAGATKIIFDLRGNPGGYVGEAVGVASQFVGDGIVYQAISRDGTSKDNEVQPGGLATDVPLIVLTDEGTASSAEIVTGAIQDAGRAEVVGETTFGTGTVLGRFDLADGSSMRIGVERWLTRDGRPIWHEGLAPDVPVALPEDAQLLLPDDLRDMSKADFAKAVDAQVQKAVELLSAGS